MKLKRFNRLIFLLICYSIFILGLLFFWNVISEPFDSYFLSGLTSAIAMLLVPIYGIFHKNRLIQKLTRVIFLIFFFILFFSIDFFIIDIFEIFSLLLVVIALVHAYRFEIKTFLSSLKEDSIYIFKNLTTIPIQEIKKFIFRFLPLIALYLLAIINFLNKSDYEALIVSILAIFLIVHIFNSNDIYKKYLKYLLYLLIIGIIFYWIEYSYGLAWSLFNGYLNSYDFSCFFTDCYGETGWTLFTQSSLLNIDLKILFYIGVIYLAIKTKK
jgi:hypothetical protein